MGESHNARKLRVLLVAPSLRSIGGQAVQAELLLNRWRRDSAADVRFLPMDPALPLGLGWLEQIRFLRTLVRTLIYVADLARVVSWADVVHIFSASYWSFLLRPVPALVIGQLRRKRVVLNYHSGEARDHLTRWRTALPFLRRAHKLVVPSGYLATVFDGFGLPAAVIPNLVELDQFRYRPRRPLRPHLLCTRNFEPYYGVEIVVRAFSDIKRDFPSASLCLVGGGKLEPTLRQLVRDLALEDVEFAGPMSPHEMPRFYKQADIFVNGSRLDNLPLSILEAFAAGLPVVSTAPEGMSYVVEHERTGLLCQVDDWQALAGNILRVLRDPELADSLARNACAATARFQWKALRELWLEAYDPLLSIGESIHEKQVGWQRAKTGQPARWAQGPAACRKE